MEIFDYQETSTLMIQAISDGDITIGPEGDIPEKDRKLLTEVHPTDENLYLIAEGNDPDSDGDDDDGDGQADSNVNDDYQELSDSDSDSDHEVESDNSVQHEAHSVQRMPSTITESATQYWNNMCEYSDDISAPPNLSKLPKLVIAQTGELLNQTVTVDMQGTAKTYYEQQLVDQQQMGIALECFALEMGVADCPRSWKKAMNSSDKQKWIDADEIENQRMLDFDAYDDVNVSEVKASGKQIGHLIRCMRVKPNEHRVRWVYDEARAEGAEDVETYASVLRLQTSRMLNLKAANKGQRVLRGDLTSAFLHVRSKEVFHTYYPEGHPKHNSGQCMAWKVLLYGKGAAPRGLRQDLHSTLLALGFEQQSDVDQCFYVHHERDIDFGMYVDDVELTASTEQIEWVRSQMEKRYEIKWLGYTCKNCDDSTEDSKTYVGVRTEMDPLTKIVTQDQTALIRKMAKQFNFDPTKPRYSPPADRKFPSLDKGAKIDPKFHTRYRSKVGCVAHLAVCTRVDLAFIAVYAARRLNDPVPECEAYIDEALQYVFSTAEDKLIFNCSQDLGSTLVISSDASLADAPDGRSTGGWVSQCGGAAWSWGVDAIKQQVLSSTEAEYVTCSNACKEVVAQKKLFQAFRLDFPDQYLVLVDNMSAIALACGPAAHHQRTKHIEIKYHYQRQLLLEGVVRFQHQATGVQVADILTKNLGKKLHKLHRDVLFGRKSMQIISHKLPESRKEYIRRHNDEVTRRQDQLKLAKGFAQEQAKDLEKSQKAQLAPELVQALLAMLL